MSPRTVYSELGAKIKQCEVTLTCDLVLVYAVKWIAIVI
jgi:hypothetical protein